MKFWPGTKYPPINTNSCLRAWAGATQESGSSLYYVTLLRTIRTRARNHALYIYYVTLLALPIPLLLYLVVLLPYPISLSPTLLTYPILRAIAYPTPISYIFIIVLPYLVIYLPTLHLYIIIYLVKYVVLGYGASPIAANRWLASVFFGILLAAAPYFSFMSYPTPIIYYLFSSCTTLYYYIIYYHLRFLCEFL